MNGKSIVIGGIDPGLANSGFAWVEFGKEQKILSSHHLKTTATKKKIRRVDEDNVRRMCAIIEYLQMKIDTYKPAIVAMESFSAPRNASAAGKVALAWGAIYATLTRNNITVVCFSPQEIKTGLGLQRNASKEMVQSEVKAHFPTCLDEVQNKTSLEHVADAFAAIYSLATDHQWSAILKSGLGNFIHQGECDE